MNEKKTGLLSDAKTGITDWREQLDETIWNELTEAEKAELLSLGADVEAIEERLIYPPYYVDQRQEDRERTELLCDLRVKTERINELITGYPQTGSMASIVAHQMAGSGVVHPDYRLERRIEFFGQRPSAVWKQEKATFGDEALESISRYVSQNPNEHSSRSPIISGHFRRDDDAPSGKETLYSYVLGDCEADPNGDTAFQRNQPEGTVYLNGIGTRAQGVGLGMELMDDLLTEAGKRRTYASVRASNFNMMHLLARAGEHFRDPAYQEGPQAGRSRFIELLYWRNYFPHSVDGNRVMALHDPGDFYRDVQDQEYSRYIVDPRDIDKYIGRRRIALHNAPALNSANHPITRHLDRAVYRLLHDGEYIGIPLGNIRLFVRTDSLEPRLGRSVRRHYEEVDAIRQEDYAVQRGEQVLKCLQ